MVSRPGHYEIVAREAIPYMLPPAMLALVFWWFTFPSTSLLFLVVTAAVALFFRNPSRASPPGDDILISPADGRVVEVLEETTSNNMPGLSVKRISIFMSPFNVHVNRNPVSGVIKKITYAPGCFLDAREKAASIANEKNSLIISTDVGDVEVVQIAGFLARRISCWVRQGDIVTRGERFGLIHFGSRLDVYLPQLCSPEVKVGARVRAGVTVIARMDRLGNVAA